MIQTIRKIFLVFIKTLLKLKVKIYNKKNLQITYNFLIIFFIKNSKFLKAVT